MYPLCRIYLRRNLLNLNLVDLDTEFVVYSDSQSAIALVNNEASQSPSKHIDIRLSYIKQGSSQESSNSPGVCFY